jgi:hypothetical protein
MNKEQIIDEAYENYLINFIRPICPPNLDVQPSYYEPMTKEWFVKSAKEKGLRGDEFSEKWGLKIEERELSLEERMDLCREKWSYSWNRTINLEDIEDRMNNDWNIPTRLITLTYNNKTITSYES